MACRNTDVFGNGEFSIILVCFITIFHTKSRYKTTSCSVAPTHCLQSAITLINIYYLHQKRDTYVLFHSRVCGNLAEQKRGMTVPLLLIYLHLF